MKAQRLGRFAGVLLVALAACQSGPLPAAVTTADGDRIVTVTPNQGGAIRLAINAPMRTQATAKVYADIHHLTVKLKRKSDDALVADAGSVTPVGTTTHVTFNNVTTGVIYYLEVDAFDSGGVSIAKTSPTKSGDIDVNAATTINASMALPLQDGSGSALNFTFTSPTYFTATNYQVWVTNAATGAIVSSYRSSTNHPTMSGLADGNYVAWAAALDTGSGLITPVKQLGTVTVASGAVTAPVGGTFTVTFGSALTQWASGAWTLQGLAVDAAGAAYGVDQTNSQIVKVAVAGGGATTVVGGASGNAVGDGSEAAVGCSLTFTASNPAGVAVDSSGNIFLGDTFNKKLRMVPKTTIGSSFGYTPLTGGQIYTLETTATSTMPKGVGVDAGGTVYWTDGNTVYSRKPSGVATAMASLPPETPLPLNGLAVDRKGNVYAAKRQRLCMYVAVAGTYFGVDQSAATGTWIDLPASLSGTTNAYRQVAVDPLGNLYVADFPNETIWALDAISGTRYRVVGTGGAGGGALADGGSPVAGSATGVFGVAIGPSGGLYFTTTGAIWKFAP